MTDLDLFLIPQRTLIDVFRGPIYFVACMLPVKNGLQCRNSDFIVLDKMNFSTLCTIFVIFGPETPEFTLCGDTAKIGITSNISERPGPILTCFTSLVGMIIPIFVWWLPKGRCYGNQLNLEDVCRRKRSLLFASTFDNGLADRKSAFKRLNGFAMHLCQTVRN